MRVLITGVTGFVGSHLADSLVAQPGSRSTGATAGAAGWTTWTTCAGG